MERRREELEEDEEVVVVEEEEEDEEEESVKEVLKDRLRLSSISIAQAEASKNGVDISEPIMACIADLSFKFAVQLAIDLEQFSRHAGRKCVNMEDVLLSTHRNEHLAMSLRSIFNEIRAREAHSQKKRKKPSRKEARRPAPPTISNSSIAATKHNNSNSMHSSFIQ